MVKPPEQSPAPRREEEQPQPRREAGDRPLPTPEHIGNLPEDNPVPGAPALFPTRED